MPRDLQADQEMLRQVLAYAEQRDIPRAAAMAEQALAEGFEHPLLLNVVATRLELEGRLEDALRLLERAISLAPADVGVRNALSLCLQRLNRPAEALQHVEELLKAHPDLAFAHACKGNALISLGALSDAKQSHLRALELDPRNLAARISLASIATHRGEHDEARKWARGVLSEIPGFPDAVMSLAAAELATGATDSAQLMLGQLLADPRAGVAEKSRANGLLGDVLDAEQRYSEAFDAYRACNESLRKIHRTFSDETSVLSYTHALIDAVQVVPLERWGISATHRAAHTKSATDAFGHAFLIGFPRSGTTLLEVALDGHPKVVSLEEHELLTDGVLNYMREPLDFGPLLNAKESELDALRDSYWQQVRMTGVDVAGKLFIDKHPLNTLKLPLIARLFPSAKILFACRDPRDVVLSCYRRRFSMNPAMYQLLTLKGAADFYDAVMRFAAKAQPVVGMDWKVVHYENLVAELPQQLDEICAFLGLEPAAGLSDFAPRMQVRERATPSTAQLARGLSSAGIGHWRHYTAELEKIMPVVEPWVQRFGYGD